MATITLGFSELWKGACATGKRKFNVDVNGMNMLTDYDVGEAGGGCFSASFQTQTFQATTDGEFIIDFNRGVIQNPLTNIIDIQV